MVKKFFIILAVVALLSTAFLPAFAASITIVPPKFEFDSEPSAEITDTIKIVNKSEESLTLQPSVQDFVSSGETGQPTFVDAATNESGVSIGDWIDVNGGANVVIPAGQRVEVPFTISVPSDAEPGGHYGAIFFSPPAREGQINVTQRIGSLILVRVSGEIREEGNLNRFDSFPAETTENDVAEAASKSFFGELPADFGVRWENTGNVHFKPTGKIEITNLFGQKVAPVGVESILNERGVELEKEIVDYIPVNNERGNVLGNSFRSFVEEWAGEPFWFYNEDGTKEIRYKDNAFGMYTATLTLLGPGGETITDSTKLFVLPIVKIAIGLGVIVLLVLGFFGWKKMRAKSQRDLEERIRKQIANEKKSSKK